jgi:hypothetical protein
MLFLALMNFLEMDQGQVQAALVEAALIKIAVAV